MPVRKVAFLTPAFFDEQSHMGGEARAAISLARGIVEASRGAVAVEIISCGPQPLERVLSPLVTLRILPTDNRPQCPTDAVSWELPAAIADADLVHLHQAFTRFSEVALLTARQQRKGVCVTDGGAPPSQLGGAVGSLELADLLVCPSEFAAALLRPHAPRTPTVVIRGGVDLQIFRPPVAPVRRDRVLFVGRLLPPKGVDLLIAHLPPGLPLTVCGPPCHDDYFRRLQALSAGKPVEFIAGADDDTLRQLYQRSWVTVLPSVYQDCYGQAHPAPELRGLRLLESLACGTPVLASRMGGLPEFIRDGETGFVFDDPPTMTRHLRLLAGDPTLVDRLGRQARRVAEQEYGHHVAGARLLEAYAGLLNSGRGIAA
jgi:glycosyltransferase involved in cell wall biosynthesis